MTARALRAAAIGMGALALAGCQELARSGIELPAPLAPPDAGVSHLEQGQALLAQGDHAGASRAFTRSLAIEGATAAALSGLGVAAEKRGLLSEAERYFSAAVAAAPGSLVAHNNLGAVQYRRGELEAARQSFRTAFALSSGTSQIAQHNLGLTETAIRIRTQQEIEISANPQAIQRLGTDVYRLGAPLGLAGSAGIDPPPGRAPARTDG